jgi:hypothetical protein
MGRQTLERTRVKLPKFLLSLGAAVAVSGSATSTNSVVDALIVVGAPGEKEFAKDFAEATQDWIAACRKASRSFRVIEPETAGTNQLSILKETLPAQTPSERELWIVLVGHGTFDGKDAKFNLTGPDISAKELSGLLRQVDRPIVLINSSSSSAPFMNELSHSNRVVVTATKSGWEENYTRFGRFFAKSVADAGADLDQDGQVSVLEAFLMASRQVEDFYTTEKRLATEHALLDDNGDGKGTSPAFFKGVRPAKEAEEGAKVDGFRAHQFHFVPSAEEARLSPEMRRRRDDLEMALEELRKKKEKIPEAEYMAQLEKIALELSRLYRDSGRRD